GKTNGVGAGEDLGPGRVVTEVVLPGGVRGRLDDGSKFAAVPVGARRPGSYPGTGGGGRPSRAIVGEGLFPFAFKALATDQKQAATGQQGKNRSVHGDSLGMCRGRMTRRGPSSKGRKSVPLAHLPEALTDSHRLTSWRARCNKGTAK